LPDKARFAAHRHRFGLPPLDLLQGWAPAGELIIRHPASLLMPVPLSNQRAKSIVNRIAP
jgi:hypothetical protein